MKKKLLAFGMAVLMLTGCGSSSGCSEPDRAGTAATTGQHQYCHSESK